MRKEIKSLGLLSSLLLVSFIFQNCSEVKFKQKAKIETSGQIAESPGSLAILSSLQDKTVVQGDSVELSAVALGDGLQVTYQWSKNSLPINEVVDSKLEIENSQIADSGLYNLRIFGDGKLMESLSAQLKVLYCSPGSTQSCSISNGQGQQTCSPDGSEFSQCEVASCNSGFHASDGTCIASEPCGDKKNVLSVNSSGVIRCRDGSSEVGASSISLIAAAHCKTGITGGPEYWRCKNKGYWQVCRAGGVCDVKFTFNGVQIQTYTQCQSDANRAGTNPRLCQW